MYYTIEFQEYALLLWYLQKINPYKNHPPNIKSTNPFLFVLYLEIIYISVNGNPEMVLLFE